MHLYHIKKKGLNRWAQPLEITCGDDDTQTRGLRRDAKPDTGLPRSFFRILRFLVSLEDGIDFGLIPPALGLEPVQHVLVQTDADLGLD